MSGRILHADSSKGHESADQVTRYSVNGARVVFTPALEMKPNLSMLSYAKADDSRVYDEGEERVEVVA